jgi:hypothetical protein
MKNISPIVKIFDVLSIYRVVGMNVKIFMSSYVIYFCIILRQLSIYRVSKIKDNRHIRKGHIRIFKLTYIT